MTDQTSFAPWYYNVSCGHSHPWGVSCSAANPTLSTPPMTPSRAAQEDPTSPRSEVIDVEQMATALIAEHGAGPHEDCRAPIIHAVIEKVEAAAATPSLDVERLRTIVRDLTDENGWPKSAVGFDAFIDAISIEYARLDEGSATPMEADDD